MYQEHVNEVPGSVEPRKQRGNDLWLEQPRDINKDLEANYMELYFSVNDARSLLFYITDTE